MILRTRFGAPFETRRVFAREMVSFVLYWGHLNSFGLLVEHVLAESFQGTISYRMGSNGARLVV